MKKHLNVRLFCAPLAQHASPALRKWHSYFHIFIILIFAWGGVMPKLRAQSTAATNPLPDFVSCGFDSSDLPPEVLAMMPACNYTPPNCIRHIKVNVTFIQKSNGTGNFTQTGPPMDVQNSVGGGMSDSDLPPYLTGQDYAENLICGVNKLFANNTPDNMCNGWYFYTNPASPFYDPSFVAPQAPPPTRHSIEWRRNIH